MKVCLIITLFYAIVLFYGCGNKDNIESLEYGISALEIQISNLRNRVSELEAETSDLRNRVSELEEELEYMR